jgi:hypothetical protein
MNQDSALGQRGSAMTGRAGIRQNLACAVVTTALVFSALAAHLVEAQQPLTSLRAIHALTNAQASHQLPVLFEATVTYDRSYEQTLFVQDGDVAIFVRPAVPAQLEPGDRVLIKGTTHESFRPFVAASSVTVLGTRHV